GYIVCQFAVEIKYQASDHDFEIIQRQNCNRKSALPAALRFFPLRCEHGSAPAPTGRPIRLDGSAYIREAEASRLPIAVVLRLHRPRIKSPHGRRYHQQSSRSSRSSLERAGKWLFQPVTNGGKLAGAMLRRRLKRDHWLLPSSTACERRRQRACLPREP